MAYFDVDDPIRKQLAEKYESSGKGPTITVDAVTGETSLGAKKNPTAKDWRDSYENYMRQGGSPLTAPTGMSATRMYQHPVFKGRGMSYYSSEPFESTGFLGEIQQDIAVEDENTVSDSVSTPYTRIIPQASEQELVEGEMDDSVDLGYATGYGTTLAGPEVDLGTTLHSAKNVPSSPLFTDFKDFAITMTVPGGFAYKGFNMLFGDHPTSKPSRDLLEDLGRDFFDPKPPPTFVGPFVDYGDVEGGATPSPTGASPSVTEVQESQPGQAYGDPDDDEGDTDDGSNDTGPAGSDDDPTGGEGPGGGL